MKMRHLEKALSTNYKLGSLPETLSKTYQECYTPAWQRITINEQMVGMKWEVNIFRLACIQNEKHVQHVDIKQIKMANNQGRKPVIIVKSVIHMSVKNVLKIFIPVIKYKHMLDVEEKNDWICWKVWLRFQSHECYYEEYCKNVWLTMFYFFLGIYTLLLFLYFWLFLRPEVQSLSLLNFYCLYLAIAFFATSEIRIPIIRSLWNGATYYQLFHSYLSCSLHICKSYAVICCWKGFLISHYLSHICKGMQFSDDVTDQFSPR